MGRMIWNKRKGIKEQFLLVISPSKLQAKNLRKCLNLMEILKRFGLDLLLVIMSPKSLIKARSLNNSMVNRKTPKMLTFCTRLEIKLSERPKI